MKTHFPQQNGKAVTLDVTTSTDLTAMTAGVNATRADFNIPVADTTRTNS